ncbi:hypothetical protein [Plantibacter sp. RU18]|uniref:hypothetical protein n=1 Tax=Plantibacter sp. RU18 TaxID=3158143 RepID=UPI003D36205C
MPTPAARAPHVYEAFGRAICVVLIAAVAGCAQLPQDLLRRATSQDEVSEAVADEAGVRLESIRHAGDYEHVAIYLGRSVSDSSVCVLAEDQRSTAWVSSCQLEDGRIQVTTDSDVMVVHTMSDLDGDWTRVAHTVYATTRAAK